MLVRRCVAVALMVSLAIVAAAAPARQPSLRIVSATMQDADRDARADRLRLTYSPAGRPAVARRARARARPRRGGGWTGARASTARPGNLGGGGGGAGGGRGGQDDFLRPSTGRATGAVAAAKAAEAAAVRSPGAARSASTSPTRRSWQSRARSAREPAARVVEAVPAGREGRACGTAAPPDTTTAAARWGRRARRRRARRCGVGGGGGGGAGGPSVGVFELGEPPRRRYRDEGGLRCSRSRWQLRFRGR